MTDYSFIFIPTDTCKSVAELTEWESMVHCFTWKSAHIEPWTMKECTSHTHTQKQLQIYGYHDNWLVGMCVAGSNNIRLASQLRPTTTARNLALCTPKRRRTFFPHLPLVSPPRTYWHHVPLWIGMVWYACLEPAISSHHKEHAWEGEMACHDFI